MSPNPNHAEDGKFTTPPETGPDWSAFEQAGITPDKAEEVAKAYDHWQRLNNLDHRQEALQSVIRPDIDTWLGQQPEAPEDPLAQYATPQEYEEEEYQVPQQPQMPDLHQFGTDITAAAVAAARADWQQQLQQMFADQQITDAASAAVKDAGLPPTMASLIEHEARQRASQQPNRSAAEIATEIATERATELREHFAQNSPPPIGSPSLPGGPVPSVHSAGPPDGVDPETWALERSREGFG
jgi:hypothetical protein